MVQPFIFTRYPPPGRRIRTVSGPVVHLHSPSTGGKAYPDPEWSSRSSSLAIHRRESVSGPRVVQSSIFARYPPPDRPVRTLSGPGVHLYSPSTAVKAFPDRERSSRSSSLAIRRQEGVSGPRMVQPFIFFRYPLSLGRKAYPDHELSRRLSSLVIRREEGVSGPRIVQRFILPPYPSPGRRFQTPSGPGVHLHSISATRKAYEEPEGSRRLSSLAIRRQEGVSGPRVV